MEWLRIGIEFLAILIANGAFFYTITRKLKKLEVKEKEIEIVKKQDDEWLELYYEAKNKVAPLEEKVSTLYKEKADVSRALLLKDVEIEKLKSDIRALNWYRCTVNGCPNRRPPHVFDKDGNELESPEHHD